MQSEQAQRYVAAHSVEPFLHSDDRNLRNRNMFEVTQALFHAPFRSLTPGPPNVWMSILVRTGARCSRLQNSL